LGVGVTPAIHPQRQLVGGKETTTTFTLTKAWPTKLDVVGLKAGETGVATITVTFTASSLTRGP
jgi:hypothetical protein